LSETTRKKTEKLSVLLRLAVVLHRRRSAATVPEVKIRVEEDKIRLRFPPDWLEDNQLTTADLEQESAYLRTAGYRLKIR
jgi:exopolyphosphatase/guanosine-5'-triphosphate,3'-diphosphate pyrophosphatase